MTTYTAGWITVPGRGKRWRTAEGEYLTQRPAGSAPGVLDAIKGSWNKADAALGGWLPGGGVANPASGAVRAVSKAALNGGVLSALPREVVPASMDALGALGVPALGMAARTLQPRLKEIVGDPFKDPTVGELGKQHKILESAHNYLRGIGSGVKPVAHFEKIFLEGKGLKPIPSPPGSAMIDFETYGAGLAGPHFSPGESRDAKGMVRVNPGTPAWVWAHEFGHAADHIKRPGAFLEEQQFRGMSSEQKRGLQNSARLRPGSPGVATLWSRPASGDRSVLEAGAEGALFGLAANWDTLSKEVIADIHGRKIAKDAGVPWNNRQNMAAKGSYALSTAGPGFVAGVAEEVASRGTDQAVRVLKDGVIDPIGRRLRGGDSSVEQGLRKYGYDPKLYTLDGSQGSPFSGEVEVRQRNPLVRGLAEYLPWGGQ